jgi:hypothetical protein
MKLLCPFLAPFCLNDQLLTGTVCLKACIYVASAVNSTRPSQAASVSSAKPASMTGRETEQAALATAADHQSH